MELSVTWLPNFESSQSDSKSLASSNSIYKTVIISATDQSLVLFKLCKKVLSRTVRFAPGKRHLGTNTE